MVGLSVRSCRVNGEAACHMSGAIGSMVGLPFRGYRVNSRTVCQGL